MSRRPAGDWIDVHVGKRVRERRVQLGMSLKALAQAVGVSFQQLQKNERGTNRIGAGRMYELSKVLDVPVSFFFDDLPPAPPGTGLKRARGNGHDGDGLSADVMASRETRELVASFYEIDDVRTRRRLLAFVRGMSA